MKYLKIGVAVIVSAVIVFFAWNYFAGPLKSRRDMQAFAESVATCEPISQSIPSPLEGGGMLNRSVDGMRDGRCHIRMEDPGPYVMHCAFAAEDLQTIGKGFKGLARQVGIFGGFHYEYSSSEPDALTVAFNSDACTTTKK